MTQENSNQSIALLVIDVQQALFERGKPIYKAEQLLENLNQTIAKARKAGILILIIQHENDSFLLKNSPGWQLHPGLNVLSDDRIIFKRHGSAFQETDMQGILGENNIDQLVIGGLVSQGCVKATVLDALSRGFSVVLLKDGHSNYHQKASAVIDEWNDSLQKAGARLETAEHVSFS